MKLSDMPNIGKTLEKLLIEVGITNEEELRELGSIEAVSRLALKGEACYNKLYAIEGALQSVRWHSLPKDFREELKRKYDENLNNRNQI